MRRGRADSIRKARTTSYGASEQAVITTADMKLSTWCCQDCLCTHLPSPHLHRGERQEGEVSCPQSHAARERPSRVHVQAASPQSIHTASPDCRAIGWFLQVTIIRPRQLKEFISIFEFALTWSHVSVFPICKLHLPKWNLGSWILTSTRNTNRQEAQSKHATSGVKCSSKAQFQKMQCLLLAGKYGLTCAGTVRNECFGESSTSTSIGKYSREEYWWPKFPMYIFPVGDGHGRSLTISGRDKRPRHTRTIETWMCNYIFI